jgi:hypothetical protein
MSTGLPAGFKNFGVSKCLCLFTIAVPVVASLTSTKYLFFYSYEPFLSQYHQFWRLFTVQLAFINESEVFLATVILYQYRNLERLYGARKYVSLIAVVYCYTLVTICLLASINFYSGITFLNGVSSGPSAILFALLANYREFIPVIYRFEVYATEQKKIVLTNQFLIFLLSFQLSVSQGLRSMSMALLGWVLGDLISRGVVPGKNWRIPYWNRLMEKREETPLPLADADADADEDEEQTATETRPLASQFLDTFRR